MPIRMVEDDPQPEYNNDRGGRGGNGGGGSNILIGLIMMLFRNNPKLALALLVIAGLWWLFGKGCGDVAVNNNAQNVGFGAEMKQEVFDKAEVFEPLSPDKNVLPSRVSLENYAPKRLNQGQQGSCVAWASAYSARTILQSAATGVNPNQTAFSPAFLYNQIGLRGCQGAYIKDAMDLMMKQGAVPFNDFPYTDEDCERRPSNADVQEAAQYRMRGYNRLTKDDDDYQTDLNAIKQNLAQGAPVVIGMQVGGSFIDDMFGREVWVPTNSDYNKRGFSGHAMSVIGYDDNKQGGTFQIMNSWGPEWGKNGIGWVKYRDFQEFVREAYGVYPLVKKAIDTTRIEAKIGLYDVATKRNISLKSAGEYSFTTTSTVKAGTKFKVEVTNSLECYVYVFGQETDGSSYVLFPYTKKHSPYCGITGTRLFPKDFSMQPDNVGKKDYMAVVMSKKPLDFQQLNVKINASRQGNYLGKLKEALGRDLLTNIQYQAGETIQLQGDARGGSAVLMVMEVNK